jgi:hypothetical protein
MNYDEEEILSDSGFNLNDGEDLDNELLDEPLEEKDDFKFGEEETESI